MVGVGLLFFGGAALLTLIHQVGSWLLLVLVLVVIAVVYYYRYLRRLEVKSQHAGPGSSDHAGGPEETGVKAGHPTVRRASGPARDRGQVCRQTSAPGQTQRQTSQCCDGSSCLRGRIA